MGSTRPASFIRAYIWEKVSWTHAALQAEKRSSSDASLEPSKDVGYVRLDTYVRVFLDIIIFFSVGSLVAGLINRSIPTLERGFYCGDASIAEPFHHNTVSVRLLLFTTILVPLLIFIAWERLFVPQLTTEESDVRQAVLRVRAYGVNVAALMTEYLMGYSLMILVMELGKSSFGRLRPHFLAVCRPRVTCAAESAAWVPAALCAGDPRAVRTARQSFPSGHSSAGVYAAVFLVLYLFRHSKHLRLSATASGVRLILGTAMVVFSVGCALSRITDFWHFPSDVVGGVVLGIAVAVWQAGRPDSVLCWRETGDPPE